RRAEAAAAVVVRRQGEVEAVDFLLEDDGVVHVEPAAPVGHRRAREEPALGPELAAQRAQLLVAPVVVLRRRGHARDAGRPGRGDPGAPLGAKALLLLAVRAPEAHRTASLPR